MKIQTFEFQWVPVEYFNNKIICDLVEERHRGIIDILDEECLRPGEPSDKTFLTKLEETMGKHPHFVTWVLMIVFFFFKIIHGFNAKLTLDTPLVILKFGKRSVTKNSVCFITPVTSHTT